MLKDLIRITSLYLSTFILVSCNFSPEYERPQVNFDKSTDKVNKFVQKDWWLVFGDKYLDELERNALLYNSDIEIALARVEEAYIAIGISRSNLFPKLSAYGGNGRSKTSERAKFFFPGMQYATDFKTGLNFDYEIDLFGKYRSLNQSARALFFATDAAKEAVRLTITSEVAKIYFTIVMLNAKLFISKRNLTISEDICSLKKKMLDNGYISDQEYLSSKSDVNAAKIVLSELEQSISEAKSALAILTGNDLKKFPDKYQDIIEFSNILKESDLPSGIPSDILECRPDLIQAENQLIAANADIGSARAAFFPSIILTGMFGFESQTFKGLIADKSNAWSASAGINLPISSGGSIFMASKAAKARYKTAIANYKKTVKVIFKEAFDAIVANKKIYEICNSKKSKLDNSVSSYDLFKKQKDVGLISPIDLYSAERALLSDQSDYISSVHTKLLAIISLCKAFGGGWKSKYNND